MNFKSAVKKTLNTIRREKQVPIYVSVPETKRLEGKVALVTGGTGGIGKAISQQLIQNGASVVLVGSRQETVDKTLNELGEQASQLRGIAIDMSDVTSFANKVEEAASLFPTKRIDILINAAGVIAHERFPEVSLAEWCRIMDINLTGTFFLSQAVAKHMISHKTQGHILNISSASALRPATGAYQVSKWAVNGMTKGMADELVSYGITVNAIGPGPVATSMLKDAEDNTIDHPSNPSTRYATPEEIAELAVYLVSDASRLIVGDTVYITGGAGTITYHK